MKVAAFDIGGVCISLTPERAFSLLGIPNLSTSPEIIQINSDYSCGRIGSFQFYQRLHQLTGNKLSLPEFRNAWNAYLGSEIPITTRLAEGLMAQGWKLVFLSDTQPWHIEQLPRLIPYYDRAAGVVFSCDVGKEKPHPRMYQAFEEQFGKPDLYLDDRLNNIEQGLAQGWNARQYTPELAPLLLKEFNIQ